MQRPDGLCSSVHRLATNIFFECVIVKTDYNAAVRSRLGFASWGLETKMQGSHGQGRQCGREAQLLRAKSIQPASAIVSSLNSRQRGRL